MASKIECDVCGVQTTGRVRGWSASRLPNRALGGGSMGKLWQVDGRMKKGGRWQRAGLFRTKSEAMFWCGYVAGLHAKYPAEVWSETRLVSPSSRGRKP